MDARAPACPRCGYDQSGAVAGWADACPLAGRCSECGMGFRWGEVLDPRVLGPRWSFEHGRRASPRRWLLTGLASLAPWVLWSGLTRDQHIRLGRLVVLAGSWLLAGHVAVVLAALRWDVHRKLNAVGAIYTTYVPPRLIDSVPLWLWPYRAEFMFPTTDPSVTSGYGDFLHGRLFFVLGTVALCPLWLLAAGAMSRRLRVGRRHLVRAALLSVPTGVAGGITHMALFAALFAWASLMPDDLPPHWLTLLFIAVLVAYPVLMCWWWRVCLSRYFGLARPGWMSFGLLAAVLMSLIACAYLIDYLRYTVV